jgi:hypothetical protein
MSRCGKSKFVILALVALLMGVFLAGPAGAMSFQDLGDLNVGGSVCMASWGSADGPVYHQLLSVLKFERSLGTANNSHRSVELK